MSQATDSRYDTPLDSAISAALKEPAAACSLPGDFTGRFVRHMNGAPTRSRLPRWLKLAACFALLLSGAAFAVTVVVDAVTAKGNGGEEMVGSVVPNSPDAHILNGAPIASEMGGTRSVASSEVQAAPSVSSVPSTDNRQTTVGNQRLSSDNQPESEKGKTKMNLKQKAALAAAAVTVAGVALPAAGVASATSGAMASFSSFVASRAQTASTLENGFHSFVAQTIETDTLPQFNSRQPRGMRIVIQ